MKELVVSKYRLQKNIDTVKKEAENVKIYAVLKNNGYSMGLLQFAEILRENLIKSFAVTEPADAITLRENGFLEEEILLLSSTAIEDELLKLIELDITFTIGSYEAGVMINSLAIKAQKKVKAHIEIDTGMGRYGFMPEELEKILLIYRQLENISFDGMYSHFYAAAGKKKNVLKQLNSFLQLADKIKKEGYETGILHIANSAALFRFKNIVKLDAVRIGSAFTGRLSVQNKGELVKCSVAYCPVCETRWINKGKTIGYGGIYKTKRPTRIAVVPFGYSDGFCLARSNDDFSFKGLLRNILSAMRDFLIKKGLYVVINDKKARVLGRVGIAHIVVDVTDIPCEVGDLVAIDVNPATVSPALRISYE